MNLEYVVFDQPDHFKEEIAGQSRDAYISDYLESLTFVPRKSKKESSKKKTCSIKDIIEGIKIYEMKI